MSSYSDNLESKMQSPEKELKWTYQKIQDLLWPRPQHLSIIEGSPLVLPKELAVRLLPPCGQSSNANASSMLKAWERNKEILCDNGYTLSFHYLTNEGRSSVICGINWDVFHKAESYVLTFNSEAAHLSASDYNGLNHGIRTFIQLIFLFKDEQQIPQLQIQDWPSLQYRALKVDLTSKTLRIPKLETLKIMVELWSKLKFNQLHLHYNLVPGTDWQIPYTPIELLRLETDCNECGISLVPSLDMDQTETVDIPKLLAAIKIFQESFTCVRYIALGESLLKVITSEGKQLQQIIPFDLSRVTLLLPSSFMSSAPAVFKLQSVEVATVSEVISSSSLSKMSSMCLLLNPLKQSSMCHFDQDRISNLCCWTKRAYDENYLGVLVAPYTECSCTMPVAFFAATLISLGLAWNHNSDVVNSDVIAGHVNRLLFCEGRGGCVGQVLLELGGVETHAPILWQLLEDPDSVDIEKYTGHMFQRAVRQLQNCQSQLHKMDWSFPRGEEIQAEILLLSDLLILAARVGKHLVTVGTNPNSSYGISVINVGIANLPPTAKTDLANKLLGLIKDFRTVWLNGYLSNNMETTLLKLNNLFNLLVAPDNVSIV